MRRILREYKEIKRTSCSLSSISKNEKLAVAYYLYKFTEKLYEQNYQGEIEYGNISLYDVLWNLAKACNKTERFSHVLESFVEQLTDFKLLNPINFNNQKQPNNFTHCQTNENSEDDEDFIIKITHDDELEEKSEEKIKTFKNTFPFFKEDSFFRRDIVTYTYEENFYKINFYRCLGSSYKNIISRIIALTFFSKGTEVSLKKQTKVPQSILNIVNDISQIDFLKKNLGLSHTECLYILANYRQQILDKLNRLLQHSPFNITELYASLMNVSLNDVKYILRPDQKLIQYGFFNSDFEISQSLVDCIAEQDINIYFSDLIKTCDDSPTFELNTYSVTEERQEVMKQLLKGDFPISILFYGKPGSGKTEFAKSLIKACGKKAVIFKNEAEISEKDDVLRKLNCLLSLKQDDTVLIVDEAESLLRTSSISFFGIKSSSDKKGTVNKMLDESHNKTIWIVNNIDSLDDSTRRRFTVSCKFQSMSSELLQSIAVKKLESTNINEDAQKKILDLIGSYNVTGASVDNIVKAIKGFCTSEKQIDNETLVRNVEIVLKENSLLLNGNSKMRESVSSSYDFSVLNTSMPAEKILSMIKNAQTFSEKNMGQQSSPNNGIRMLFYGLSGSGKTEFARYISQELHKKILLKRPSDIFSKYVGDNEENIKRAFDEAATNNQILLFDEADSFFSDRQMAHTNWERTLVNEFLTQMEEFPGILICTTNLRQIMDPALLRRFHITVDFKSLQPEGIRKLMNKYFASYNFTNSQINSICQYESATPGDFGRLAGQLRFRDEKDICPELIVEELCNIQKEKLENGDCKNHRKIGFSD